MDQKTYLIEILLRAREQVAQVAQRAAGAIDKVTKAQDDLSDAAKRADAESKKQIGTLEQMRQARVREKTALDSSADALRKTAAARRIEADESRKRLEQLEKQARLEKAQANEREKQDLEEITRMRSKAAEMNAFAEKRDKATRNEIAQLRREASAFEALAREESATNRKRAAELDLQIAQRVQSNREAQRAATEANRSVTSQQKTSRSLGSDIRGLEREISKLGGTQDNTSRSGGRLRRVLQDLGLQSHSARGGVGGLNSELQSFQVALFIKYIQSIITAVVGLAGQFVAVAAAAAQAGAGIAGALAAGAAQAVPVIAVLSAALLRVKNVLQAVKLQNQQQLTATKDSTAAAKAQRTAAEQVAAAQQQVGDAHRSTAQAIQQAAQVAADAQRQEQQAQRDVTQARKDAIRTVEDLIDAEKRAQLSVEDAQAALRSAVASGDVAGVAQAQLGLQEAQTGRTRARQDAAPVRARGVEGVQAVQQAEQRLADVRRQNARQEADAARSVADAQRFEQRAVQNLNRVRRDSTANLAQETAAANKLKDTLAQLTPAERELYTRILRLQGVYRRVARPITDIITRSFTGVVDAIITKLQDPRIIGGFRAIAVQIARSIRTATREAGGPASTGAFEILSREAARNIPIATRILVNFFRAARNLVLDALPAFRRLLRYVEGYSREALDASRNSRGITDFFVTGVRYANSFFRLGLAVVRLFLAIGGQGGAAAQGRKTVDEMTGAVDRLTRRVRSHSRQVRNFFSDTSSVLHDVMRVAGAFGLMLINAFNPKSVKALADFLTEVIIPAMGNAIAVLGGLVNIFHQLASLPGVSTILQFAATILIIGKGLGTISSAISSITSILPTMLTQMGLMASVEGEVATGSAVFAAMTPGGWIFLAIMALVAAVVLLNNKFHFLAPTWRWLKHAAADAFDALKGAGRSVLHWFSDVWTQGLLYWIRWPFMKLGQLVPWRWIGHAIKDAFNAVLDFFTSKQRGGWAALQTVLLAPFRFFGRLLGLILEGALLPIRVFLDIIAGRFGDAFNLIKGFFSDLVDAIAGGFTSFLGVIQTVIGALAKIPGPLGAPFRAARDVIKDARKSIDDWRESLRHHTREQKKSTDATNDSIPRVRVLRNRYQDAKDQLKLLTPGTDAYKDAVKRARRAHNDLNDELKTTRTRARQAQGPVGTLGANIAGLGTVSYDTAANVKDDLNAILKHVGADQIKVSLRRHRTAAQQITGSDNPLLGSPFAKAYGGYASPFGGGSADDHILLSPGGMPVAAMSGTEGIVNTPQMGAIDTSLALSKAMGVMPWGSLNELWGSGMRHYQTGGSLHWDGHPQLSGAIARAVGAIERKFPGLSVTSTTDHSLRSSTGGISLHSRGLAADLSSGDYGLMNRAASWIKRTMGRSLLEGIHNPNLSIKNGREVPASLWAQAWGQHLNHIHIALSRLTAGLGGLGGLAARVRTPQFTGLGGSGAIGDIARGGARRLSRAANAYLARVMAAQGGGDRSGAKALGADANVVAGFRRAMRDMRANRTERLAGWEAGIVESGLKNLHYGDADSLGSLQERASIFGRAHALNPYASMVRFLRDAESRRPWRSSPGLLAAAVQRPRADLRGRYDQVRGQAMRYMQTGGGLRVGPARSVPALNRTGTRTQLSAIIELMSSVSDALGGFTARRLRRVKDLGAKIRRGFEKLTEDGGVFDQMNDAIEAIATRATTRLQERQFRIGKRGPRRVYRSPAQLARDQQQTLQAQRTGLADEQTSLESGIAAAQRALHEAQRRHNKRAAAQAQAAITNLRARLNKNRADLAQNAQDQVEAQEAFQQALVDQVNNQAQAQTSHLDRLTRLAQLGGVTNYGAIGGILQSRQNVMLTQRAGLESLLGAATRTGNVDLATNLRDQIDELNTQLAENTQAIQDNTDEAFNARTTAIQNRATFATGIFGAAQSFFQNLGTSLGINTTAQQGTALQGVGGALAAAQGGLKAQLAALLGYTPDEASQLQNLTGGDLVSFVMSIASGPAFEAILSRLDPTQQAAFQDLLSALVDNATATQQNTDAIAALTAANQTQSFTSSFWSAFRVAVFNGAGGLLPQYQATIPGADVGARVLASGALMVHAGENVRPAHVARDWGGPGGGDTYNVNVSTPTQVLNPTDVGRQLAFYRKNQGR